MKSSLLACTWRTLLLAACVLSAPVRAQEVAEIPFFHAPAGTAALGGGIRGGQVHGQYPDLTLGNELDIGSGIFIPTLPTDALYASLGRWMGVKTPDLAQVLPNLNRFPDAMQRIDLFA